MDIKLTTQGFLENSNDWNEDIAYFLAKSKNIDLTTAHWEIINFIRQYYLTYSYVPNMRIFIKALSKKLGEEKGNSRYLHQLFLDTPLKTLCQLAGLPKPPHCL